MPSVRETGIDVRARILLVGGRDKEVFGASAALERHGVQLLLHEAPETTEPPAVGPLDLVFLAGEQDGIAAPELLRALKRTLPGVPVVVLVPRGSVDLAVESMRAGASDCLAYPASESELLVCLRRNLDDELWEMRRVASSPDVDLIGDSPALRSVRRMLTRAAQTGVSAVLVSGPAGSGKTRAARFIHGHLPRAPYIRVACEGVLEGVLADALFGETPGSPGAWARARGGFLCLEDLPRLPLRLQQELERRLDEQEERALPRRLQVRVIGTARHGGSDPEAASPLLDLRLMTRFSAAHVQLPRLTERPGDIRLLGRYILADLARRVGRPNLQVSEPAWTQLEKAPWRGNVRELQSALEAAVLRSRGDLLTPDLFDLESREDLSKSLYELPPGGVDLAELERRLLVQALERSGGNRTKAGALLGINRDQVRYRIEKFGLEPRESGREHKPI